MSKKKSRPWTVAEKRDLRRLAMMGISILIAVSVTAVVMALITS